MARCHLVSTLTLLTVALFRLHDQTADATAAGAAAAAARSEVEDPYMHSRGVDGTTDQPSRSLDLGTGSSLGEERHDVDGFDRDGKDASSGRRGPAASTHITHQRRQLRRHRETDPAERGRLGDYRDDHTVRTRRSGHVRAEHRHEDSPENAYYSSSSDESGSPNNVAHEDSYEEEESDFVKHSYGAPREKGRSKRRRDYESVERRTGDSDFREMEIDEPNADERGPYAYGEDDEVDEQREHDAPRLTRRRHTATRSRSSSAEVDHVHDIDRRPSTRPGRLADGDLGRVDDKYGDQEDGPATGTTAPAPAASLAQQAARTGRGEMSSSKSRMLLEKELVGHQQRQQVHLLRRNDNTTSTTTSTTPHRTTYCILHADETYLCPNDEEKVNIESHINSRQEFYCYTAVFFLLLGFALQGHVTEGHKGPGDVGGTQAMLASCAMKQFAVVLAGVVVVAIFIAIDLVDSVGSLFFGTMPPRRLDLMKHSIGDIREGVLFSEATLIVLHVQLLFMVTMPVHFFFVYVMSRAIDHTITQWRSWEFSGFSERVLMLALKAQETADAKRRAMEEQNEPGKRAGGAARAPMKIPKDMCSYLATRRTYITPHQIYESRRVVHQNLRVPEKQFLFYMYLRPELLDCAIAIAVWSPRGQLLVAGLLLAFFLSAHTVTSTLFGSSLSAKDWMLLCPIVALALKLIAMGLRAVVAGILDEMALPVDYFKWKLKQSDIAAEKLEKERKRIEDGKKEKEAAEALPKDDQEQEAQKDADSSTAELRRTNYRRTDCKEELIDEAQKDELQSESKGQVEQDEDASKKPMVDDDAAKKLAAAKKAREEEEGAQMPLALIPKWKYAQKEVSKHRNWFSYVWYGTFQPTRQEMLWPRWRHGPSALRIAMQEVFFIAVLNCGLIAAFTLCWIRFQDIANEWPVFVYFLITVVITTHMTYYDVVGFASDWTIAARTDSMTDDNRLTRETHNMQQYFGDSALQEFCAALYLHVLYKRLHGANAGKTLKELRDKYAETFTEDERNVIAEEYEAAASDPTQGLTQTETSLLLARLGLDRKGCDLTKWVKMLQMGNPERLGEHEFEALVAVFFMISYERLRRDVVDEALIHLADAGEVGELATHISVHKMVVILESVGIEHTDAKKHAKELLYRAHVFANEGAALEEENVGDLGKIEWSLRSFFSPPGRMPTGGVRKHQVAAVASRKAAASGGNKDAAAGGKEKEKDGSSGSDSVEKIDPSLRIMDEDEIRAVLDADVCATHKPGAVLIHIFSGFLMHEQSRRGN
eukprot:CAMPEP_0178989730 /NCGR_PEP_ID=MMETSP0795-20121207/4542_1 /TAXON_ID=88552 /ORGANISM="Amoebophrya sp., Strain Ameob2" /LENGTH=1276 /DNA_ID=CAMNT_0020681175 /DNA_START=11 /DNA_END=3844 /DNA_ORIENTATION=-